MNEIDLVHLSRCYGLAFSGCDVVVPGVNRIYRLVAEAEVYYLRLYRPIGRSHAAIAFELHLLQAIPPTPGIDVARPIRTLDGADCTRIVFEGVSRVVCLFQALRGRPITYEPDDMALFGSALAKLHGALAEIDGGEARPLDPQAMCARATTSLADISGSKAVRRAIDRCHAALLGEAAAHDLPSGNCHGDAWAANALIEGDTVGFFDFDDCGRGPYLLDLGTAAWHLASREAVAGQEVDRRTAGRLRDRASPA